MQNHRSQKRGCGYWLRLLTVGLVGGLALACLAIEVFYIHIVTRSAQRPICCQTPADLGLTYETVSLTSSDGIVLSGWYIPSQNGAAVILLHGYGASRMEMLPRAEILARHGFGVLLYDERAHGESGGQLRAFGWQDVPDVMAALDYLETRPDLDGGRSGILGFSVGGQIALRAAAETQRIQAVVADDPGFVTVRDAPPPATIGERLIYIVNLVDAWGVSLRTGIRPPSGVPQAIDKIAPRPILFISTGQGLAQRLIRHYYSLAGEPKSLWEIPETHHGGQVRARPEEYEQKVVEFFSSTLLSESSIR